MNKKIAGAVAALMLVAASAQAIPVLDQESTGPLNGSGSGSHGTDFGRAQTFTVGVDGVLSTIMFLGAGSFSDRLDILSTAGGVPVGGSPSDSTVLGTVHTGVAQGDWLSYDVSALNISVAVGDVLAFKVWAGHRSTSGSYSGGAAYFFNSGFGYDDWILHADANAADLANLIFRTYVEDGSAAPVPLPASGLMLGSIAVAGLMRGRRRMA